MYFMYILMRCVRWPNASNSHSNVSHIIINKSKREFDLIAENIPA